MAKPMNNTVMIIATVITSSMSFPEKVFVEETGLSPRLSLSSSSSGPKRPSLATDEIKLSLSDLEMASMSPFQANTSFLAIGVLKLSIG